ncbi:PREDICTED: juxtaposed with another zinc finger protein 1-like [Papilio xuthus]|uniref:Juxtaposed with another zinc finger protein 1 n=1 Tax=Papilio xuthus TaxID=66420 RepID=A0A194Q365_PAPXU|nr:PREDICTED: juxtaposed with another zinc finger protein 1-like [Papilio xuthus]KPI99997.1 Juxtaposed with another zinc finger protein 1 [Papilio xuthus]
MAVFMINICKFNGCGITFPRLADLIEHIEDVHIDYDPAVVEQKEASQPACIPLSYVLRFFTEASRREFQSLPPAADVRRRLLSAPKTPSVRSSTPTGSEVDDDELMSPSEDSNDSWTTVEEYSSEYILRYGVKMNSSAASGVLGPAAQEKPFACPVPGCKKRYKNVNGIKYHSKNGHKKDGKVKKAYKCQCGKSYKTAQGLKSHTITQHIVTSHASTSSMPPTPPTPPTPPVPDTGRLNATKMPGLVVTASPAHSRSLNIIDGIDASKLVRIYDSIKTKDLPSFTIPKHNLTNINLITSQGQGIRHSVLLAPTATLVDKSKYDRSPKVTVNAQPTTAIATTYDI